MQQTFLNHWTVYQFDQIDSTNDHAGKLPAWSAVTAKTQTKGRGRYRRNWVSDEGGIWLSASVPTPAPLAQWSILPLAAGWALRDALHKLGVPNLRLRWPNDVMIGRAKLAGILVERFRSDLAVIGVGINYLNSPEALAPELKGLACTLSQILRPLPDKIQIITEFLSTLSEAQKIIAEGNCEAFLPTLNAAWEIDKVAISLHDNEDTLLGTFLGVDREGQLLVRAETGAIRCLSPLSVERLREVWPS